MEIREPYNVEGFENGDVELRIYHYSDPLENRYWLRIGGCCGLQMYEKGFEELRELMRAYEEEDPHYNNNQNCGMSALLWIVVFLIFLFGLGIGVAI